MSSDGKGEEESQLSVARQLFAGRYEVREKMSWNGLALMFRATEPGREVAVAALPIDAEGVPEAVEEFVRHAELLELVDDPHLVPVTDSGVLHGVPYLEFDYIEARTLGSVLEEEGRLDDDRVRHIATQILRALEQGHTRGIHHWDLTPANVLLRKEDGEERARVVGFGIAPLLRSANPDRITAPTGKGSGPKATHYLAPELRLGSKADRRADFYSVGALIAHMVTGAVPPRDRPEVEHRSVFYEVVARATATAPEDRYRSTEEMLADLVKSARHEISVATTLPAGPEAPAPSAAHPPPPGVSTGLEGAGRRGGNVPVPSVAPAALGSLPPKAPGSFALLESQSWITLVWERVVAAPPAVQVGVPLVVLVAVGFGLFLKSAGRELPPSSPVSVVEDAGVDAGLVDAGQDAGPPDPLAGPLPEILALAHRKSLAGEVLERSELKPLHGYTHDVREDVRGHLVLAHAFMDLEWYSDAMDRYETAYEVDKSALGDPRMLDDYLEIVTKTQSLYKRASSEIERIYGPSALPAVKRALAKETHYHVVERLKELVARLEKAH